MAFNREAAKTPAAVGMIVITLIDAPGKQAAEYRISVEDQNGERYKVLTGDLVPHLSAGVITQLQTFLGNIRNQAETEIL